ncbi:MAG: dihydropteroate synthase, partial [Atopobium sp.]|nr:dihydropteroate synthase [Atopobium sp.]
ARVERKQVQLDDMRPSRPTGSAATRAAATGAETRTLSSQRRFTLPEEAPIMRQIMGFLGDQARGLMRAGVSKDRICIDPGPGFDKFAAEDVVIQRATRSMVSMGYPLLCAVSRKRFVGAVSGVTEATQRDAATHAICIAAITNGARILRVHDVAGTAQAINAYWAMTERFP